MFRPPLGGPTTRFRAELEKESVDSLVLGSGIGTVEQGLVEPSFDFDFASDFDFDYGSYSSPSFSSHSNTVKIQETADHNPSLPSSSDSNISERAGMSSSSLSPSSTSSTFLSNRHSVGPEWTNSASSRPLPSTKVPWPTQQALPLLPAVKCSICPQSFASSARLA